MPHSVTKVVQFVRIDDNAACIRRAMPEWTKPSASDEPRIIQLSGCSSQTVAPQSLTFYFVLVTSDHRVFTVLQLQEVIGRKFRTQYSNPPVLPVAHAVSPTRIDTASGHLTETSACACMQVLARLKGDLPLPWEEDSPTRRKLGLLKDPVLQLLRRRAGDRIGMRRFHSLAARTCSGPTTNSTE